MVNIGARDSSNHTIVRYTEIPRKERCIMSNSPSVGREPLIDTLPLYQAGNSHPYRDDAESDPVTYLPGAHAVYGGDSWGVAYSGWFNSWVVNHGFFGALEMRDGEVFIDGSSAPLATHERRWAAVVHSGADGAVVWQYRDDINEALVSITAGLNDLGYGDRLALHLKAVVRRDHISFTNIADDPIVRFGIPLD